MEWRRLDVPGRDGAELRGGILSGASAFLEGGGPCLLRFRIELHPDGRTRRARVRGRVGAREVDLSIGGAPRWSLNGRACPELAGVADLDLSFSPASNLLPLRRLRLRVGEAARVRSAWLRVPELDLRPLDQRYRRLDFRLYRYEAAGYAATLEVDPAGFVLTYPGLWSAT